MKPSSNVAAIRELIIKMEPLAKRDYEAHYICEEDILGSYLDFFCDTCPAIVEEPDINTAHCPCEFDSSDPDCVFSYRYERLKDAVMFADMILRAELGDHWKDEYSEFLSGVCIWVS